MDRPKKNQDFEKVGVHTI